MAKKFFLSIYEVVFTIFPYYFVVPLFYMRKYPKHPLLYLAKIQFLVFFFKYKNISTSCIYVDGKHPSTSRKRKKKKTNNKCSKEEEKNEIALSIL